MDGSTRRILLLVVFATVIPVGSLGSPFWAVVLSRENHHSVASISLHSSLAVGHRMKKVLVAATIGA